MQVSKIYDTLGTFTVTLTVTNDNKPANCDTDTIKATIVRIDFRAVNDGLRVDFEALGTGGDTSTPTVIWSFDVDDPDNSGNGPEVAFSDPTELCPSVPNAKWFAYPDGPCHGIDHQTCKYNIYCTYTFPHGTVTAKTALFVDTPGNPAGLVECKYTDIDKYEYDQDPETGEYYYTGIGQVKRTVTRLEDAVFIPQSSQFYQKLAAHEQVHIEQFTGANNRLDRSTYWTIAGLEEYLTRISELLTADSLEALHKEVETHINIYHGIESIRNAREFKIAHKDQSTGEPNVDVFEVEAYNVSDGVAPLYRHNNCGSYVNPPEE